MPVDSGTYTPEALERRRRMAEALMGQSMSGAPVGSHLQGLSQLAQTLAGMKMMKDVERGESEAEKQASEHSRKLARALMGGDNPNNLDAAAFNAEAPGELQMVETTAQRLPDRSEALQLAMSPQGARALQDNPVMAQMFASQFRQDEDRTASVLEYEYARRNGFNGSFQDWVIAGGQSSRPSAVQEWEFFSNLPDDQKRVYLEMKRNPNMQVKDIGHVPTVIAPSNLGTTTTPLSSLPQETSAAEAIKRAEAQGSAVGKAEGEITGGIQTKGANAVSTTALLDEADALVDKATGSLGGRVVDAAQAAFGRSNEGAEAIARLKVIQAGLMTNMPRMEGPQSDRDVQLYREAAGQIGDPTVPAPIKKAALATIRAIQKRYIQRAGAASGKPKRVRVDAEGNIIGD